MATANYNILQHSDLTKRGGARVSVFLAKIKDGEVFMTTKGDVILDKKQDVDLEKEMPGKGFSTTLKGKIGSKKVVLDYPKDFYKTPEFGGKGAGSGTAAEDRHLVSFRKQLIELLSAEKSPYIKLKIGHRLINCADIISTPQTGSRFAPKADFSIIDHNGEEVGWISHKDGSKPEHFQQYGGLSDSVFANISEVKKFVADLQKIYPEGLQSGISVKRKAKDKNVILMSVFGIEYGGKPGKQNVDEFHQGDMKLKKVNKHYVIASTHKGLNGEIPEDAGYICIYFARYTSDRGANIAGKFIGNARVGIFPEAKAGNTTITI